MLPPLQTRAEYYLCLARAWLPPICETDSQAFRDFLADDLSAIASEAGYVDGSAPLTAAIAAYAPNPLSLLRIYSDLFLVPPTRVFLNTGVYFDQSLMGTHTLEIMDFYRWQGVEKREDFSHTPDHLSVQLEFLAYQWARAAEAKDPAPILQATRVFIGRYLAPCLTPLREALIRESAKAPRFQVYLVLADLLCQTVEHDLAWLNQAYPQHESAPTEAATVAAIDSPAALQSMIAQLQAAGLDTAHLQKLSSR